MPGEKQALARASAERLYEIVAGQVKSREAMSWWRVFAEQHIEYSSACERKHAVYAAGQQAVVTLAALLERGVVTPEQVQAAIESAVPLMETIVKQLTASLEAMTKVD